MLNKPMPFWLAIIGTVFLMIAVIGNSRLAIIEINPGGFGRFLGLILGIIFYLLAFSSSLPIEFWQMSSDATINQVQEYIKSFAPDPSQLMTYLTKLKLEFSHF